MAGRPQIKKMLRTQIYGSCWKKKLKIMKLIGFGLKVIVKISLMKKQII